MKRLRRSGLVDRPAVVGDLVILLGTGAYTFTPDHPLRNSDCLLCRRPIGGHPATVVGVAPLVGEPCDCGGLASDAFLIHNGHVPINPARLATAINRAMKCPVFHNAP